MFFPIPEDAPVINTVFIKKRASNLYHTATTIYPCCIPTLGDSMGAGCISPARNKYNSFNKRIRSITFNKYLWELIFIFFLF